MVPYFKLDKDSACLISLGIEFHMLTPRTGIKNVLLEGTIYLADDLRL